MQLNQQFTVDLPADQTWDLLTDVQAIAPCLPGARLTGSDGDTHTGEVKLKVGPVSVHYQGTIVFLEKDASTHHAVLDASGKNQTARSIPALKMHGRLVTVTGAQGDLNLAMRKDAAVHFTHLEDAKAKLDRMRPLFERGLLRSVVSAAYPLEKVAEAHGRVEQGGEGTYGKVVVEVGSGG